MWLKNFLGCRVGFHRFGPWKWDKDAGARFAAGGVGYQRRRCREPGCDKEQVIPSSELRRVYESWRDR
jgi:hypothetical protein